MKYYIFIPFFFHLLFFSCSSLSEKKLEECIANAGNNKPEILTVLKHYKDSTLKLEAARFLLENMPGHYAIDSNLINHLKPYYIKHRVISEKYHWDVYNHQWIHSIDSLRDSYSSDFFHESQHTVQADIENIKANWLIKQIELAFDAWQTNSYTQNISFKAFCEYILPYRTQDGLILDNAREVFFYRHRNFFNDSSIHFQERIDSLLSKYQTINHSNFAAINTPIYSISTLELIKRGLCEHKCWFNATLLTTMGIPTVIDFVPAWGNRNSRHSWNAIVLNGETYPFEPFWDEDPWKYKNLYNNKTFDLKWGKFRLPKVYRHTYSYHLEGPAFDNEVNPSDIPSIFKNPNIIDVSSSYFETVDINIKLPHKTSEKVRYCYLCVYGNGNWQPIQWGKIQNKKASFKSIGKDIVYLPAYFINGKIIAASNPFYLDGKGEMTTLKTEKETINLTLATTNSIVDVATREKNINYLSGTYLLGKIENRPNQYDTLFHFSDTIDNWQNNIHLNILQKYRYIHLLSDQDTLALNEIIFYEKNKDSIQPINNIHVSGSFHPIDSTNPINYLIDNLSTTGSCGKLTKNKTICFDLGKPCLLSSIQYYPYVPSTLKKDAKYELFYWNNGWKSGGVQKCNGQYITFKNIPQGTLYRLKEESSKNERIFTWENGLIYWM